MGSAVENVPILSTIEGEYQLNREMAARTIEDAKYNAEQRIKQADITLGEQMAAAGTSGLVIDGSLADVMKDDYANAYKEAQNIIYTGKLNSYQMKRSAQLGREKGYNEIVKTGGLMAIKGGI